MGRVPFRRVAPCYRVVRWVCRCPRRAPTTPTSAPPSCPRPRTSSPRTASTAPCCKTSPTPWGSPSPPCCTIILEGAHSRGGARRHPRALEPHAAAPARRGNGEPRRRDGEPGPLRCHLRRARALLRGRSRSRPHPAARDARPPRGDAQAVAWRAAALDHRSGAVRPRGAGVPGATTGTSTTRPTCCTSSNSS